MDNFRVLILRRSRTRRKGILHGEGLGNCCCWSVGYSKLSFFLASEAY